MTAATCMARQRVHTRSPRRPPLESGARPTISNTRSKVEPTSPMVHDLKDARMASPRALRGGRVRRAMGGHGLSATGATRDFSPSREAARVKRKRPTLPQPPPGTSPLASGLHTCTSKDGRHAGGSLGWGWWGPHARGHASS